jgi:hypothetical protein
MRRTQPAIVKGEGAHGKYEKECGSLCEKKPATSKETRTLLSKPQGSEFGQQFE